MCVSEARKPSVCLHFCCAYRRWREETVRGECDDKETSAEQTELFLELM